MKAAAIFPKKAGTLHFVEVPKPRISAREALVRVLRVGLDGTDKEIGQGYYGEAPKGSRYLIVGHESLGIVEALGSRARKTGIKVGDLVVATVRRPDNCANCKAGESDMCLAGNYTERGIKGAHGYMSEYYKELPSNLVRIRKSIADSAVMLEPFSIAEKAVRQPFIAQKRMLWRPKTALVLGTGTVGLFAAMLLRLKGLDVLSVDRTERNAVKDRIYRRLGIRHIDSRKVALGDIPRRAGKRIDIVVELTGNPGVVHDALGIGGTNSATSLVSVTGGSLKMQVDMARLNYGIVMRNKLVIGIVNSNKSHFLQGERDMAELERRYPGMLKSMITKRIPFDEFRNYDALFDRRQIKVAVEIGTHDA